jgi:hypothetical protein
MSAYDLDLLLLRIRNAIAGREFNTADANRETASAGEWRCDHAALDAEYAREIEDLIAKARLHENPADESIPRLQSPALFQHWSEPDCEPEEDGR